MNTVVSPEQQLISTKIDEAKLRRDKLIEELDQIETELEKNSAQISIYTHLASVSNQIEELHKLGAGKLFWEDKYTNEEELLAHIKGLRTKSKKFIDEIDVIREAKETLEKKVDDARYEVGYLIEELELSKLNAAESKNYFVIDREYTPRPFKTTVMPWNNKTEDEKRFKRYILLALLYSILFILVIPYFEIPIPDKDEVVKIPERIVRFIQKNKPKPEKKIRVAKKDKVSDKEKTKARKKASKTGLLAFKNNFADLLDDVSEDKLGADAKLSKQGARSKLTSRSIVLSQAQTGSGGISSTRLSRDVGGSGGKIGSVKFSRVTSEIGTAVAEDRPLSSGPGPSRTDEEIQIVFDRYKAALYRIYNRELRKNPTLQGKMILRITILPSGKVARCKVESTDLNSASLSAKIVARVLRFNFGAKKSVPTITILYPIDFLPAS